MENLYLLTTQGLGDYYVLAKDPTEAEKSLEGILDEQSYGFADERKVKNIKHLTKALRALSGDVRPFLSDKNTRLLITDMWK